MKEFVKRCESDPLCRIPMLVMLLCLVLRILLPEPYCLWAIDVGIVALIIDLIGVIRNIGKKGAREPQATKMKPIFDRLENVLWLAVFVSLILLFIGRELIAPMLK